MTVPGPKQPIVSTRTAAVEALGEHYGKIWDSLPQCGRCDRRLRPSRALSVDWPATVARATLGACSSCYNDGFRDKTGAKRPAPGRSALLLNTRPKPVLDRAERASSWSEAERSAALQVCGLVADPTDAAQILDLLGLFEESRSEAFQHVDTAFGH